MATNQPLTTTELDTLATLINSAGNHMARARNLDGSLTLDGKTMSALHKDAVDGFYDIQLRAPGGLTRDLTIL